MNAFFFVHVFLLHVYENQMQEGHSVFFNTLHQLQELAGFSFFFFFCLSFIFTLISWAKKVERLQMSEFSDGHIQDAIITMLITERRRERKRGEYKMI